jgi:CRISPR/Cas system-associated exonuclease Cas4 (RecB family)
MSDDVGEIRKKLDALGIDELVFNMNKSMVMISFGEDEFNCYSVRPDGNVLLSIATQREIIKWLLSEPEVDTAQKKKAEVATVKKEQPVEEKQDEKVVSEEDFLDKRMRVAVPKRTTGYESDIANSSCFGEFHSEASPICDECALRKVCQRKCIGV